MDHPTDQRLRARVMPKALELRAALEDEWGEYESFDAAWAGELGRIIAAELTAEGVELTADDVAELTAEIDGDITTALELDHERSDRYVQARYCWGEPGPIEGGEYRLLNDPHARATWQRVFRPVLVHGARHRRAPGRRPVHRRGSRRTASSCRAGPGGDEPPDDGEPGRARRHLAPSSPRGRS